MDLRLVVHRGLTIAMATLLSLTPVGLVLLVFWHQLPDSLRSEDLVVLLGAIVAVSLLVPPTRDLAGRLLDRYVYRTHANYQKTVREASQMLTRVLELDILLKFVNRTVATSTAAEGAAIYLHEDDGFRLAIGQENPGGSLAMPAMAPEIVAGHLAATQDLLVTDEIPQGPPSPQRDRLWAELARLNWALLLPLVSEDSVIGAIVVGPKRSGDAFYPQDFDLLMTLANQAGIAIKNAQLYAQVVLANEHLNNIVVTMESGVVAIDREGMVTMFNRAAEELTGLPADGARGARVEALPGRLGDLLIGALTAEEPRVLPEIELPGGTETRPAMCVTSPLRDPAGAILGAVAVFSDLTALKALETERRRGERLAYFEGLASGIAHEIKNPLVAIKTFAQLIPRRQGDPAFVENFSRVVTREIGRLERVVERLRTLSRPGERPRHLLDLRAPVTDAVEFLQAAFEEKRVTLRATLGDRAVQVVGDHGDLEALILNLLLNAHEATPPGGTVTVDLTTADERATLAVADTGPGVAPELLDRIFDPFFTTKQRGSGLGLAISAGIATAHYARLQAANRPGGGAVFTVEIPAGRPADVTAHA